MRTRPVALLALALATTGCGATTSGGEAPYASLQLRIVSSTADGPCEVPPLDTDGPGSACDRAGTTTYVLGESLGVVTPSSVTHEGATIAVVFDEADSDTLAEASDAAREQQLAVLLDGAVLSAPVVKAPITDGRVVIAFGTEAEAEEVVADLGATDGS